VDCRTQVITVCPSQEGQQYVTMISFTMDDPAELSNQITAPGILKIFGNEICEGAHYKSVLATTHSSAKELVKEALERYGLGKEEAESYVLCDTIGSIGNLQWRTEGFRVVGDNEKPLLLQSLWKPREGLARRFEIQKRSSVEEKTSKEKDTITAGINAQARKLQKSRSRVTSTLIDRTLGRTQKLSRSKSEMDLLDTESKQDTDHTTCVKGRCESLNHASEQCPKADLEQNHIHSLAAPSEGDSDASKADILLCAADILPRHCCFHRCSAGGPTMLCLCQDAVVTRNGEVLRNDTQLSPGDVIGLGQHYLFLFKDPLAVTQKVRHQCVLNMTDRLVSLHKMKHFVFFINSQFSIINNSPPLTVSFLLCMCVQYSSACLQTADLRRLLLLIASGVQSAMWVKYLEGLNVHEMISGLRPLVAWMSNNLELLQFIQYQLPLILEWRTRKEQGQEEEEEEREDDESKELRLSCVRSPSEETMTVLEEVIMLAFQQCVYYITKVLYPILPELLNCNPFRESHKGAGESAQVLGAGLQVPLEIQQVVEVLTESWMLLSDCQVHHEISCLIKLGSMDFGGWVYLVDPWSCSLSCFYQWSRGVRMRANLDSLLDWAHAAGLGEVASEHTHTLSSAINLLATPRKNLLQTSWVSLRSDHPALSLAQLNHLLSLYSPASPCRHMWTPSAQDQTAAHKTADILESFDTHHPLVLPDDGYCLQLRRPVTDSSLRKQLDKLKLFISTLSDSQLNVNVAGEQQVQKMTLTILDFYTNLNIHNILYTLYNSVSKKTLGCGFVFECLSALKVDRLKSDCSGMKRLVQLKEEEEEEQEEEEPDDHYDANNEEVFSLELERGERGLGLALVDTRDTSLKVKGIFIRAVVPDSPAARCEKLVPGDRILAVNGVSLLGLDYQSGKELIQSSGARLRLLVARSAWMAEAIRTEC
uniref:Ras-associating and dilute domain-containing protein-like n=1 Tax=Acanthochromis polyacanthus TaxID=80966 RepID=A0A3Q1G4V5_9TELE